MKKKVISLMLSTILVFALASCGETGGGQTESSGGGIIVDGGEDTKIELPDYDLKKDEIEFLTTGFFSPPLSEEGMKTYMDCGFSIFCINGNNVGYGDSNNIRKALEIAEKNNIRCVIDATVSRDASRIEQSMICNDFGYQNYKSLWAVNAFDEPVTKQGDVGDVVGIDTISKYIPKFTSIYGEEMPFFINLNPFGASRIPNYNDYIKANVEEIIMKVSPKSQRWISCDSYPLIYDSVKDVHYIKANWLCNLQLIANVKKDYPDLDIKSNFYILTTPHQTGSTQSYMREIGYNEMRIQMYSLIAFGYDMCSFFTYGTPPTGGGESYPPALVDMDGNKTERWNDAKKLNDEVHKFDHVFMQFKNKGIYGVSGEKDNHSNGSFDYLTFLKKSELGTLKDVSASADTLIGVGTDEKGNYGYTVVNYNDPFYNVKDSVTFTFSNATKAVVYVDGEKVVKDVVDRNLTLELNCGEGIFVIPY